jgi:hypothetical protein
VRTIDEFIRGLDVLLAYGAEVGLKHCVLLLGEEVLLWRPEF